MKRNIYSLVATLAVVLISVANTFLPTVQAQTETAPSGSGTQADPYIIASLDNLAWLQDFVQRYEYSSSNAWSYYYKQTADIDASTSSSWNSGKGFTPIGNGSVQFNGTYDGNGHTISGLYISLSAYEYVGMFGYIVQGTVKDLHLTGVNISGSSQVGGLVGYSETAMIDTCSVTGSIATSSSEYVGGLVGEATGSTIIDSCHSEVTFTSANAADLGGFVGYSHDGTTISKCYSSGDISGTSGSSPEGGFVGDNESTITNCYTLGSVVQSGGYGSYYGGFVGKNDVAGNISSCYSTGNVEGYEYVGGFAGANLVESEIQNCYSRGNVTIINSGLYAGGFLGEYNESASSADINKCYSTGSVTGGVAYTGGFAGANDGSGSIGSSYWDVTTSGIGSDGSTSGSDGGTGESTAHMQTESTFSGWDFISTWGISGGVNDDYPYLIHTGDYSLPVQATDFIAAADMNSVTLSWSTQSEVDNAGFNIFREDPGTLSGSTSPTTGFKLVASYLSDDALKGLGTSSTGRSYDFSDNHVTSGSTYQYKIQSVSTSGIVKDLSTLSVTVDVPKTYALYQNYPNPFNPSTTIRFDLKQQSTVILDVYNVLGEKVEEWNYGLMNAGRYDEVLNMDRFASGVYFYKISAVGSDGQKFVSIKKLVLMK